MNEFDYTSLDGVLIENYDLILGKYDVVYHYCFRNNIYTLKELLKRYDNNELEFKNKKTEEEIIGLIDLIKYRHFGKKLPVESILFNKIIINKDTWKGCPCKGWSDISVSSDMSLYPLRRLGFSASESDHIRFFVIRKESTMLVIDAILQIKKNLDMMKDFGYKYAKDLFNKKLDILIDYYKKYCVPYEGIDRLTFAELEQLLYKYKNTCEKIRELQEYLNTLKVEIQQKSNYIDVNELKELLKKL